MGRTLLVVRVLPLLVMLLLLLLLSRPRSDGHLAARLLHSTVVEHLLSTKVLLLQGPQTGLLLLGLLLHFRFTHLLGSLMHNRSFLVLVKALEVVGLYSMRSEHGLFCCRVFGHKVVGCCELDFSSCGLLGGRKRSLVTVTLLAGHLVISLLVVHDHVSPLLGVCLLGLLKQLVVVGVELVSLLLGHSGVIPVLGLFVDLLFDPFFLL